MGKIALCEEHLKSHRVGSKNKANPGKDFLFSKIIQNLKMKIQVLQY
jgi:hypothetical protein